MISCRTASIDSGLMTVWAVQRRKKGQHHGSREIIVIGHVPRSAVDLIRRREARGEHMYRLIHSDFKGTTRYRSPSGRAFRG